MSAPGTLASLPRDAASALVLASPPVATSSGAVSKPPLQPLVAIGAANTAPRIAVHPIARAESDRLMNEDLPNWLSSHGFAESEPLP